VKRLADGAAGATAAFGKPVATRPFAPFEWMIAGRYLKARRREAFISVIAVISFVGILLGVATLIIVMAVMNGFRAELLGRILGMNGHMIVQPVEYDLTDYEAVAARLAAVKGVTLALPMVEGQVFVSGPGQGTGALVRGVREADIKKIAGIAGNIRHGTLDGFDAAEGAVIGVRMAQNLGLSIGDRITLISPEGDVTPFGSTPRVKAYPVTAIFEIGMSEYDSTIAFLPLGEAQLYFNSEGKATAVEVYTEDADRVGEMRDGVSAAVGRPHFLTDWRQRNQSFFSALKVERNLQFIILSLIILVAALNIVSGLFMLVKDKGRDIAILRTMGATRGAMMRIFVLTGSAIGVAGTVAGVGLGLLVVRNIREIQRFVETLTGGQIWDPTVRFLSEVPARMDNGDTIAVVAMALVLSFLATLFPAWRAAALDPVEALRYE
jgi:lipoprotein-releasing system permease protein